MSPASATGMRIVTRNGVQIVAGLTRAQRSFVAQHHNAIRTYLNTGKTDPLLPFEGRRIKGHLLETDPDVLDWWGLTGELAYESIYREVD